MLFKAPSDREYPDVDLIINGYMEKLTVNWQDQTNGVYDIGGYMEEEDIIKFVKSYGLELIEENK